LNESTQYNYDVFSKDNAGNLSLSAAAGSFSTAADNTPPTLFSVSASGDPTKVVVVFSEAVEAGSAETAANYTIDNGIQVSAASLGGDARTVTLTTSAHSEGVDYVLTVNNVTDNSQAKNAIAANSQESYSYVAKLTVTLVQYFGSATLPTVVEDGFVEGAVQANDRTGSQYTNVPAGLSGLTYLLTARDDKNNSMPEDGVMYRVNASAACTVFVLFQTSLGVPTWIGRDYWEDTGLQIMADGNAYSVYKKYFEAGNIDLERQAGGGSQGTGYVFKLAGQGPTVEVAAPGAYNALENLRVSPNPFRRTVTLTLCPVTAAQKIQCRIFDIKGKLVKTLLRDTAVAGALCMTWDASTLPSGLYVVRAKLGNRVYSSMLVLQK
jgi:hypothetical protein